MLMSSFRQPGICGRLRTCWAARSLSTGIKKGRVAVGMSGGVDSSVTAALLQQQGYDVLGVHMVNWDQSDERGQSTCSATEDAKSAADVCQHLGIPLEKVDFSRQYWLNVFQPFLDAYSSGETPNPDMDCNRYIKFGAFRQFALEGLGVDYVATGHYATLQPTTNGFPQIFRGVDPVKDQSYFLCRVRHQDFEKVLLPLGVLQKSQVREMAAQFGLPTASRKDSYGICFIGKRKFSDFLSEYIVTTPGYFCDFDTGDRIAPHDGCEVYTVGQGARIPGEARRWFVVSKNLGSGTVYVTSNKDHPSLYPSGLEMDARTFNWLSGEVRDHVYQGLGVRCGFKLRHSQTQLCGGHLELVPSSRSDQQSLRLTFDEKMYAVCPGQVTALYQQRSNMCFGGGVISNTVPWSQR